MTLLFLVWAVETVIPLFGHLYAASILGLVVGGVGTILAAAHRSDIGEGHHEYPTMTKLLLIFKKTVTISVVTFFLTGLIPSKDTTYLMIGAYGVEYLATHDTTKRLGSKTLGMLESSIDKLDLYLKESDTKAVEPTITTEED